MRLHWHFLLIFLSVSLVFSKPSDPDDFAEFDDDDFEDESSPKTQDKQSSAENDEIEKETIKVDAVEIPPEEDDEVVVEEDDFEDEDFDDSGNERESRLPPPKLTITPVPLPNRGWQAYFSELMMLTGIAVYMANYLMGRRKNQWIAQTFFDFNWSIFEDNFSLIGDGGRAEEGNGTREFRKQSDAHFELWCSGRNVCEGMLVELRLLKRQDLVSILSHAIKGGKENIRFSVDMTREEMDSIVFWIGNRKASAKAREFTDLSSYASEKKADKSGLSASYVVLSELSETLSAILDARTVGILNKYAHIIDSIHFTDQFTGLKSQEPELGKDGILKMAEGKRALFFSFFLPISPTGRNVEAAVEEVQPLIHFVIHTIDRMKRIRLTREGKMKADKNRAKVEEAFMKATHVARAEAAANRRDEKRRQEKERILSEEDPEKQRRWEEKELKREKKKKQPKLKQLKVKAL